MSLKLYDLAPAYRMVAEAEAESGPGSFQEALEQLGDKFADKTDNLAKIVRELEAESEAINSEIKRLSEKKDSREQRIQRLKDYLLNCFQAAGITRLQGPIFTVAVQDSPPQCSVSNAGAVPLQYQETVPASIRINREGIIARWKLTGEAIPGVEITQGKHIRIR